MLLTARYKCVCESMCSPALLLRMASAETRLQSEETAIYKKSNFNPRAQIKTKDFKIPTFNINSLQAVKAPTYWGKLCAYCAQMFEVSWCKQTTDKDTQ